MKRLITKPRTWKSVITITSVGFFALIALTQIKRVELHIGHLDLFADQGGFWCFSDSNCYWSLKLVDYLTPSSLFASFPLPDFGPFWLGLPWWILILIWIAFASLVWKRISKKRPTPPGFEPVFSSRK